MMNPFARHKPTFNTDCESPHDEGRSAFAAGRLDVDDACPYPSGSPMSDRRTQWMDGYYGERVRRVLEKCEATA